MAVVGCSFAVLMIGVLTSVWLVEAAEQVYVHEIYAKKSNTNRSLACGVCEARGGHLARRPELDDWEILFGNWNHLETMDFWVDLIKTESGEWYWGDGVALNLTQVSSLPMAPAYNQSYSSWNCALWNMAEPFLMPADCNLAANIICQVPTTEPECQNSVLNGMMFNNTAATVLTNYTDLDACLASCPTTSYCWAADWNNVTRECRMLTSTVSTRPAVPDLLPNSDYTTIGRTCVKFQEMTPEDSNFVCNCGAIELPETDEEKEKFVQDYKKEVKKELIVPTETLSATIRKKESAPDERKSSTGIGFLGITMMVVVFGSLVLLDLTSLCAHFKMAASNVKNVFVNADGGTTDA